MIILEILLPVLGGIAWGIHEAFYADRRIFEKKFGVGETSFWGSKSWKRNYEDNDPEKAYKGVPNVHRDVKHASAFIGRYAQFLAIGLTCWNQHLYMLVYVILCYPFAASSTYKILRYKIKNR